MFPAPLSYRYYAGWRGFCSPTAIASAIVKFRGILWGRSMLGCQEVLRKVRPRFREGSTKVLSRFHQGFIKVPPRFRWVCFTKVPHLSRCFRKRFFLRGSANCSLHLTPSLVLGSKLHELLTCLTHTPPIRRKRPIMSLLLGYSLGLFFFGFGGS